ncbi:MAG: Vms1/Ankzf1 family peptidyl-tRNA hydrolase, partial [Chloroflexi bacterium]|nr:Vms1/Ankzf1 family peptidyl-tRNA hydrolase [Chloroflexota bacterium]
MTWRLSRERSGTCASSLQASGPARNGHGFPAPRSIRRAVSHSSRGLSLPPRRSHFSPSLRRFRSPRSAISPLSDLLAHHWTVAIILLRLGHFSFGIAEDEKLGVHKAGGRYVKNRQRKGGQSAARFVRNREKAIQQLFDEVAEVALSRIQAHEGNIDWLGFGG